MALSKNKLCALSAPVEITAGEPVEGDVSRPAPKRFSATFYTGGTLVVGGWDLPVAVDLASLKYGKVLVANLDHDRTKRVGNFEVVNDGKQLIANGVASAATPYRDEVINSALDGYQWQASLEVTVGRVQEIAADKKVTVNGQEITGPAYVIRSGTLKGFGFVSHGADDNTTATVAAAAAPSITSGVAMDAEFKAWLESLSIDASGMNDQQIEELKASYEGRKAVKKPALSASGFEAKKLEKERCDKILDYAFKACDSQPHNIDAIKELADQAIEAKWDVDKFRLELLEASVPDARMPMAGRRDERLTSKVLEAAICQAGRLPNIEKAFDDQTLQAAHDRFRGQIGLNQLILTAATAKGYRSDYSTKVTIDALQAAFDKQGGRQIHAAGFSTISIATILSNVANKFLRVGWESVDMTPLRVAAIRAVNDFKTITTTSLLADVEYEKVGKGGPITHGTLGEVTYSNKADTYGRMLAVAREDFINDDLGALTDTPRKLGLGGARALNRIFWTEFLDNASFFTGGNNNVNTGVANMTLEGLDTTEKIFREQKDPNGFPLGVRPAILLVPPALYNRAVSLVSPSLMVTGANTTIPNFNPFVGRYRVESSEYMSDANFSGYDAAAWYMLADPSVLPVIEIAALYGRVEPTVESADTEFNTLGIQMRGYCDIGVRKQEYRGGVRADGGDS
jgi:hypothetical protein